MKIKYECQNCKSSNILEVEADNHTIHQVIDDVACCKCSSDNLDIYIGNQLIYSKKTRKECSICGCPILEPRKKALPNTTMCASCNESASSTVESKKVYGSSLSDKKKEFKSYIDW